MTSGSRLPTWKERENNKRRERQRRAIAAKIYAGLRAHGSYRLPKHCDNNEVLKALCDEAGWTVEPDGTTYRKGCKPVEPMEVGGTSTPASPRSSYQPSPVASYDPSPTSSYNPSPASSSYITNANGSPINGVSDAYSLIPWLKNLSSPSSSARGHNLFIHAGSISAPVTPPLSSPTAGSPRIKAELTSWPPGAHHTYLPSSTPVSPGGNTGPTSPTFSLMPSNPFGFLVGGGIASGGSSRMWTPGQSGMCSPVTNRGGDVHMRNCASDEFAFGSGGNGSSTAGGMVKPWEGERIHEECGSDELELTLGSTKTRG